MHMNQLQQQSPRLASVVCAALSTGTSLVEEEEGDNTRRKADAAPLKRSSKQLKASIGGVKRDVGTKGVDPCEEYLRLLESAEVGEIVELLESAKAQGVTEQLASVIRYKQFFDVCRQHKPVPLKEAMLFVRLCGLRDKRMYTELARLCGDADRVQEAFQLPARMREVGLKPDTILYTSIITACARRGDSNGAYEVFAAMREEAVAPNEHTYASLMTACCTEMRNLKKSAACDTTMRRRLKYLADRAQNSLANMETVSVKPDIITYNAMLDICRQSEDLERAFQIWEEVEREGLEPTAQSYGTIMSACGDAGEHLLGLRYYEEFKKRGNVEGSTELYTCAIHMCATEGDWDDAYQTYREMRAANVEPDAMVFAVLMDVAARSGRPEKAFELLKEMQHDVGMKPTSEVYSTLIGICARSGLPERAAEMFEQMLAEGVEPSVDAHNALMNAYGKAFQVSRATNVLDDLRKSKHTLPNHITYGTIFYAAGQAGDTDLALHLFMQARREGLVPSEAMCDMLLLAILKRIRAGKLIAGTAAWIPKAVYVYRECIVAGVRPGPKTLNKVLACLRHSKYSKGYQEEFGGLLTAPAPSKIGPTGLFGTPKNIMKVMGRGGRGSGGQLGGTGVSFGSPHNTQRLGQLSTEYTVDEYDAHGLYESPALTLYEESQRLGTVPTFQLHTGGKVDLRDHPKDAAQVAVLALLKHIRQRVDRPDARIGRLILQLKTLKVSPEELQSQEQAWDTDNLDEIQAEMFRQLDHEQRATSERPPRTRPLRSDEVANGRRSSLSGAAVAKLLRHLNIPCKGSAASGELLITGKNLSRWMQRNSHGSQQSYFAGASADQWTRDAER